MSSCRRYVAMFLLVATSSTILPSAHAYAANTPMEEMRFGAEPPSNPDLWGDAWNIFAEGPIDSDAAERLNQFVKKNNIPHRSRIYLDSPGGDILGAIKLGKAINSLEFDTYVGLPIKEDTPKHKSGECYSACTLSYIGGIFRFMSDDAQYGVHRFFRNVHTSADTDNAQIVSSLIVQYIRDMGIDPELFSEMTKVGKYEMNIIPHEKLIELNVINNGVGKTVWMIDSVETGLHLSGVRNTSNGENRFSVLCDPPGQIGIEIGFDAEHREDEILKMQAISLLIDDRQVPLTNAMTKNPFLSGKYIEMVIQPNSDLLDRLKSAKTVGVTFQWDYKQPLFLGFRGMDFHEGQSKLIGFLRVCRRE